jgi:hypothetical protein
MVTTMTPFCASRSPQYKGIAALRLRIKKLEEKNRELTELLEHAYGVTAEACHGVSSQPPASR